MAKIFRKERDMHIREGGVRKYLLYAIGEIVLVVVGILIAFQIDNWNSHRLEKLSQIETLESLVQNLLADTVDLNYNIKSYQRVIPLQMNLVEHLTSGKPYNDTLNRDYHVLIGFYLTLALRHSAFEMAKQQGLKRITNEELRRKISTLYEFDYGTLLTHENSPPPVLDYSLAAASMAEYAEMRMGSDSSSYWYLDYEGIIADENLHYQIAMSINMKQQILYRYKRVLGELLSVVKAIEEELKLLKL